ncbi:MAG: D-alanyl-D-alanine carboxypeptidase [Christensenellaceae bacterium]|jgi:D-alanyl-D-alanine carboxypeptidase (penicillin-binding protein 5/6)|nr:D-alanyl-D-alanine carboxypeptidase [Christensenellaceae bacterium]
MENVKRDLKNAKNTRYSGSSNINKTKCCFAVASALAVVSCGGIIGTVVSDYKLRAEIAEKEQSCVNCYAGDVGANSFSYSSFEFSPSGAHSYGFRYLVPASAGLSVGDVIPVSAGLLINEGEGEQGAANKNSATKTAKDSAANKNSSTSAAKTSKTSAAASANTAKPSAASATNEAYPNAPAVSAKAGFLLEANSGKVLFEKNADEKLPIASMTKIMTLAVIYDAIEAGKLKMDDKIMVSQTASGMGGSQAFLDFDSEYTASELIKTIVVASANDSCVALAEHLFGSEGAFVAEMNKLAKSLGMTNTNYANCTGLPAVGAYSTARDTSKVYAYIMEKQHYADFNTLWMFDFLHPSGRTTALSNTNKHAKFYNGVLGGKTGFTAEAGHCITVAAERNDLKPVAVIIGAGDSKTRFKESGDLMNYVFDSFENKKVLDKGTAIATAEVRGAANENEGVYPREDYFVLAKRGDNTTYSISYDINDTIKAPIKANEPIGKILVSENGKVINETDAVFAKDIKKLGFGGMLKKIGEMFN